MIGCRTKYFESCASTNDEASAWASDKIDPAPHGAVVIAAEQSAGRGRQGRHWHSPPGENLYFSCILRPPLAPHNVPPLTLCAGLAVCDVVNSLGVAASIKWPNDVLVGGDKLAGVLTEMSTRSQHLDAVIVGVGLNVNSIGFPSDLSATSVRMETGSKTHLPTVLGSLLCALDGWYENYLDGGVPALSEAFAKHSMLAGKEVKARVGGAIISGRAASLGPDGSLLIEDVRGAVHRVIAGDVELL